MPETQDSSASWYSVGFEELDADIARQNAPRTPRRWYLPAEVTQEITFVTDQPFVFREHNLKLDGHWRNWFTCLGKNCPLCRSGNDPYLAAAWIVVDHGEWEDNNGNQHKDEPRLFVAKSRIASRLKKIRSKRDGLNGLRMEVFRSEAMAPNTGDVFDFTQKYTDKEVAKLKWWPNDWADPDWIALFKPKATDDLKGVLAQIADDIGDDEDRPIRF
jgi:hypothetical protein